MTWVKGRSGNPLGRRPRTPTLTPALRSLLREHDPETGETYRRRVVLALVQAAMAGNVEAIKVVLERMDGRLANPVEVSGRDGGPIALEVLPFDYAAAVADLTPALPEAGSSSHRAPPGQAQMPGDGATLGQDADGR